MRRVDNALRTCVMLGGGLLVVSALLPARSHVARSTCAEPLPTAGAVLGGAGPVAPIDVLAIGLPVLAIGVATVLFASGLSRHGWDADGRRAAVAIGGGVLAVWGVAYWLFATTDCQTPGSGTHAALLAGVVIAGVALLPTSRWRRRDATAEE